MKLVSKVVFLFFSCFLLKPFLVKGDTPISALDRSNNTNYENEDVIRYKVEECSETVDLHVIVDSSSSIGHYNWFHKVSPMVIQLMQLLNIADNAINVSLTTFSSYFTEYIIIGSQESKNKDLAIQMAELLKYNYMRGSTELHAPIEHILYDYIQKGKTRSGVQQIILIFTDGIPNDRIRTLESVRAARNMDVTVGILGIGASIDSAYNKHLVGCNSGKKCKLYAEASWSELEEIVSPFLKKVCHEVEKLQSCGPWLWSECSSSCGKGLKIGQRVKLHEGCRMFTEAECDAGPCPVEETISERIVPYHPGPTPPKNIRRKTRNTDVTPSSPNPEESDNNDKETDDNVYPSIVPVTPEPVPADVPKTTPESSTTESSNTPATTEEAQNDLIEHVVQDEINKESESMAKNIDKKAKAEEVAPVPESREPASEHVNEQANEQANEQPSSTGTNENEQSGASKNEERKKKGTSAKTGYKIAGGVLAGAALLGTAFAGYKFVAGSSAAASALQSDNVPFEDVPAEGENELDDNEQYKLPEEHEWN